MIKYFADVERVISDSLESIDDIQFEQLVSDCEQTLRNGNKIIATG